jgi:fumarylacetoacetase
MIFGRDEVAPLNRTHDPERKSWIESANAPDAQFPIQNLPYGVFRRPGSAPRVGVAIGDQILDLAVVEASGLIRPNAAATVFDRPDVNAFMALGPDVWTETRAVISDLLDDADSRLSENGPLRSTALVAMGSAQLLLPLFVRSFTDFYSSKEHATNVGSMFRDPLHALTPNWLHLPIGYNGRASTVVVSGTDVRRPLGQLKRSGSEEPTFGPCQKLDLELELGAVVGMPNRLGQPVTVAQAYDMIFGYVLLNDWTARDIQIWEYQPLGPFQSKAFATTISPWIVTREALEPFRVSTPERIKPLLSYLVERTPNNFDIHLEVALKPAGGAQATTISRTNYKHMYYSAAQQLSHHAVSGCAMCTGDLLGSGTISGSTRDSLGSLLEISRNGETPVEIGNGLLRSFLEDGDTVTLMGWCEGTGYRIGFDACSGTILPAINEPDWQRA